MTQEAQPVPDTTTTPEPATSNTGLQTIYEIEQRSFSVIEALRKNVFSPDKVKTLNVRFGITEVATLVNRTTTTIRDAEKEGRLPPPSKSGKGQRRYTLEEVNNIRRVFNTLPHRGPSDPPITIAIQNFKGGVGKSTITAHLSQYLALEGYRVCVIDCDPQGSTTSLFGVNPDYDLSEEETLAPFLMGDAEGIGYALRDTYWDQLKLIPANLDLYGVEYKLAALMYGNSGILNKLRQGIMDIAHDFDVVIIDPPPALGMISLSVLRAANALIVPTRPATIDFGSTAHFFTMLAEAFEALKQYDINPEYQFLKVLANDVDESKSAHVEISKMMQQVYGNLMLNTSMKDSAEIDNAGGRLMTVYELEGPATSRATHQRCKAYLNAVNREIELLIRKCWPSHLDRLRKDGLARGGQGHGKQEEC